VRGKGTGQRGKEKTRGTKERKKENIQPKGGTGWSKVADPLSSNFRHRLRLVAMPPKGRVVAGQVDDTLFGNPNEHALRKVRTRPVELRSVGVVGAQELQGMATRAWAGPQDRRSMGSGGEERQRLKALSDARKAKWPNTLEALRAKKERARQEKAAADEAVRMALDREEDALQAEKRRVAIERANKMIYDATDRVKALAESPLSKLHLTRALENATNTREREPPT